MSAVPQVVRDCHPRPRDFSCPGEVRGNSTGQLSCKDNTVHALEELVGALKREALPNSDLT